MHCDGKIGAVDLTPSTAGAPLLTHHTWISLLILDKNMDRAKGHTNPAGLAPGLVNINPEIFPFCLGSLPSTSRNSGLGEIL